MGIKEIITILKERGLSTDEAVEFIHIVSKIKTSNNDFKIIGSLPAVLDNLDCSLIILQRNLTRLE